MLQRIRGNCLVPLNMVFTLSLWSRASWMHTADLRLIQDSLRKSDLVLLRDLLNFLDQPVTDEVGERRLVV